MRKRSLFVVSVFALAAVVLALASLAWACTGPSISPSSVTARPGETITLYPRALSGNTEPIELWWQDEEGSFVGTQRATHLATFAAEEHTVYVQVPDVTEGRYWIYAVQMNSDTGEMRPVQSGVGVTVESVSSATTSGGDAGSSNNTTTAAGTDAPAPDRASASTAEGEGPVLENQAGSPSVVTDDEGREIFGPSLPLSETLGEPKASERARTTSDSPSSASVVADTAGGFQDYASDASAPSLLNRSAGERHAGGAALGAILLALGITAAGGGLFASEVARRRRAAVAVRK